MIDFMCTASADKPVFLKFNLSHKLQLLNLQHNFCSVIHCANMNADFIDFGNNVLF